MKKQVITRKGNHSILFNFISVLQVIFELIKRAPLHFKPSVKNIERSNTINVMRRNLVMLRHRIMSPHEGLSLIYNIAFPLSKESKMISDDANEKKRWISVTKRGVHNFYSTYSRVIIIINKELENFFCQRFVKVFVEVFTQRGGHYYKLRTEKIIQKNQLHAHKHIFNSMHFV